MTDAFDDLDIETLRGVLEDFAKNWLAHDGLWFQAVEKAHGMEAAMAADAEAWGRFAAIEAVRIRKRHSIADGGGLDALAFCLSGRLAVRTGCGSGPRTSAESDGLDGLACCLSRRMYAVLNRTRFERPNDRTLRFAMVDCRVQDARNRKGMDPFPCKAVGEVEFTSFAKAVDERIAVACITCPPDEHHEGTWCAWEFTIGD